VFPLENISSDRESEYLADGICEDIITRLSKIGSLKVASRSAVFRFKGRDFDPVDVVGKLGVGNYLEGSIRRFGDDLRISVRLTRANDGFVVWSDQFDRKCENILSLQTDIAEMVAAALGLELSGGEQQSIVRKPTVNSEAYDYYLRGKFHAKKRDKRSIETAIELLDKARQLDPRFAKACAGLSQAYRLYQNYGHGAGKSLAEMSYELAARAVELDSNSAEAHVSLGLVLRADDFKKSIRELRAAIAIDPSNAEAHHYLAHVYVIFGLYMLAADEEEKALALDPFQPISRAHLCHIYFYLGVSDKVSEQLAVLVEDNQAPYLVHSTEGWLAWYRRDWERAAGFFEKALEVEPGNTFNLDHMCDCYRRLGRLDEAAALLRKLLIDGGSDYMLPARLAQVHTDMDDHDRAAELFSRAKRNLEQASQHWLNPRSVMYHMNMAWILALEKHTEGAVKHLSEAGKQGLGHYAELRLRPDWENLQTEPTFRELVKRIEELKEVFRSFLLESDS
jgi:TolB-like protein/tetratricopeptide (TPR) repeat protein